VNLFARAVRQFQWGAGGATLHVRQAVRAVGKIQNVVRAFGDLKEASRDAELVVPQWRIMRHHLDQLVKGSDRVGKKIVDLPSGIVDEANHVEPDRNCSVGVFKYGTFHVFLVAFEKDA
jgi:hypothetical protein